MIPRWLHDAFSIDRTEPNAVQGEQLGQWSQWTTGKSRTGGNEQQAVCHVEEKPTEAREFICENCGYNLCEHAAHDRCPECGTSVQWSILERRRRRDGASSPSVWFIFISAGAGALSWYVLFGYAFAGLGSFASFIALFVCFGVTPAFLLGLIHGKTMSVDSNMIEATIFSWPSVVVGGVFLLSAADEPGVAIWFGFGVSELLLCIGGCLIGRRFK